MKRVVAVALACATVTGLIAAFLAPSSPEAYGLVASSALCGVTFILWSRRQRQ
jgi:hypothetical protein